MFRNNDKKRTYLAKRLIGAKFKSMNWLIPYKRDHLYGIFDIDKIRNIEAWQSKVYWQEYFNQLGIKNGKRRDDNNEVKKTLDAVSKFVAGIILRWILYHNLSPFHGFLHKPTDYPALVYDLMEPYRGFFDEIVFKTIKENQEKNLPPEKNLPIAIENIKKLLEKKVYIHSTRQISTFQELLHGIVLSLRVYLLQETRKFIIPMPEKPNGGRSIKAGFKLYGHSAGITDFWSEAKSIAGNFNLIN
jgi:CRISPR/Cas system-associated endonuclease Cas1